MVEVIPGMMMTNGKHTVVSREHSRIALPSAVLLKEDGAEVLGVLLGAVSDVIPIELGYQRCNWGWMFSRQDKVGLIPMFEEMTPKSLVFLRLTSQPAHHRHLQPRV